jgi:hypothetical protein
VREALAIDYARGLATVEAATYDAIVEVLRDELPHAWHDRYKLMCDGPTSVLVIAQNGFDYLFDHSSLDDREDRLVAAFGLSREASGKRKKSRIQGFPGSDERGDRGHFVAHAAGGALDINLFHQAARLNRGWSAAGKRYREMERYCAAHEGTFFFSRPVYADATARPAEVEFGVLRHDLTLWVELFENR